MTKITITEYLILSLAVFRLTRLITTDLILSPVRGLIWRKFPPSGNGIGYLITCDWCTSIWVASPVFALYKIWPTPTMFVCGILAVSAAAGILSRVS
jgi:hypothetical protein